MDIERRIFKLALGSRLAIIALQFLSNVLIPDHKADAFVSPHLPTDKSHPLDWIIELSLGGFRRWDAQYFLHIAEYGYTHDNVLAFYPLYPYAVSLIAQCLHIFTPWWSIRAVTLIAASAFSLFCFVMATVAFYRLTKVLFPRGAMAEIATVLFVFNPASVFFSAPYSESLFAWTSFTVMLRVVTGKSPIVPLVCSILCRSNGMVNVGFVVYALVRKWIYTFSLKFAVRLMYRLTIVMVFFVGHQLWIYYHFCDPNNSKFIVIPEHVQVFLNDNQFIAAGNDSVKPSDHWCYQSIPMFYSYIQERYWSVGFLKYYQLKQIPNFALATPAIYLFLKHLSRIFRRFPWRKCLVLENRSLEAEKLLNLLPFYVHATFLTFMCIFFVHTQVTTRFLASSSPCFFWFAAEYFSGDLSNRNALESVRFHPNGRWIRIWFLAYLVIGTVLFSNFLPWT